MPERDTPTRITSASAVGVLELDAVVVVEREVHRLDTGIVFFFADDAVALADRQRGLLLQFVFKLADKGVEEVDHHGAVVDPDGFAHERVDDRHEHQRAEMVGLLRCS